MAIRSSTVQLLAASLAVAGSLSASTAFAQATSSSGAAATTDARWRPWLGCWIPVERAPRDRDIQVCILPAAEHAGTQMMTFAGDQRVLDESILADGSTQSLNEDGCKGSSRSLWSSDAARLFRLTELSCEGKPLQRTAGISTLEGSDKWLDVQVVVVGASESVRTRHYARSSGLPPASIADQVRRLETNISGTDVSVSVEDVIEANGVVAHRAVEAWLVESSMRVPVNKRTLLALHDATVPAHMIDLMVALAYPNKFEVHRSGGGGGSFGGFSGLDDAASWSSPWDFMFDPYAFYYSPFGTYHGFVDPLYMGLGGYVTVPIPVPEQPGSARVVNGSGYTRIEPRQPASSTGRPPNSGNADSTGSDGGSSSSSSSSSSSDGGGSASPGGYSAGGGGGGGTAVPR